MSSINRLRNGVIQDPSERIPVIASNRYFQSERTSCPPHDKYKHCRAAIAQQITAKRFSSLGFWGGLFLGILQVWWAVNLAEGVRVGQFPVTRRFAGNDFRIATIDVPDPALRVQKQEV